MRGGGFDVYFYNVNWNTNEIFLNGQSEIERFNKTNLEHKLFIEECLNNKEKRCKDKENFLCREKIL